MSHHEQPRQNNYGIEFEVPQSADSTLHQEPTSNRPFSIDLSLELERQLDMEPTSPNPYQTFSHTLPTPQQDRESLDPHILASIIMQLRQSLEEVSKERDGLLNIVSSAHSKEAELKDALELMTEKATGMEEELSEARKKMKDDEDAIAMLRTKVEESRRGLMRLQTENRRQSIAPMTIDMSRAGLPSFGAVPASSKRASFTPMTGSIASRPPGHRRISSVSDSGVPDFTASPSPHSQTFAATEYTSTQHPTNLSPNQNPTSSRRPEMSVRGSPPRLELPPQRYPVVAEVETLQKELRIIKDELEETRIELSESNEAREASETCVKALREFIGENNVGAGEMAAASESASVKLPPPPTMTTGEETDTRKTGAMGAGWGFKLWKVDTSVKSDSGPTSATSCTASPTVPQNPTPSAGAPLSRKLGGFFSSRASVSSVTSNTSTSNNNNPTLLPQLQSNAATSKAYRDSMYSCSDTSSVAEPISPTSEVNGNVVVTVMSDLGSSGASPVGVKGGIGLEKEKGTVVLG